ncbi:MAG: CHASE domain-containing protein [Deltaproteobacteria bacterium]|nr:CHASE domain-containing protein [Deltaproteobacteria bacterium]
MGLIITIVVFFVVREKEVQEIRSHFHFTANSVNTDIKDILESDIDTLQLIEALFQGSEFVTRDEFQKFVQPVLARHPHILLFGWLPSVKLDDRKTFHRKLGEEGISLFDEGRENSQLPENDEARQVFYPVYYLEGPGKDKLGLGTDMADLPEVYQALAKAEKTRTLGAIKIDWPSQQDNQQIYMVFLPIFGKNYLFETDRPKNDTSLGGFIFGLFPVANILQEIREKHDLSGIKIDFFEPLQGSKTLINRLKTQQGETLKNLEVFKIGNRELLIRSQSLPGYVPQRLSWRPGVALAAGIFLVGLLLIYLEHTFRRTAQIELLAEKLSAEVVERKRVAEAREKLVTELEAKNAELERFTYTVSHDLKSPLITIRGFTGLLAEDARKGDTERVQADATQIKSATDKMQRLLDELLELSRIGRLVNPPREIDLNDLIQETLTMLGGRISESKVEISVSDNLPVIYGDRPRLLEVFQNLIDNAVKFMGKQPTPRVEIYAEKHNEHIKCFVCDNGAGIPERYKNKIFGLFERLDQTCEGTGIGLALVKRIVEFHGGRIWVESDGEGKGSTFVFTLPAKQEGISDEQFLCNEG